MKGGESMKRILLFTSVFIISLTIGLFSTVILPQNSIAGPPPICGTPACIMWVECDEYSARCSSTPQFPHWQIIWSGEPYPACYDCIYWQGCVESCLPI